MFWTLEILDKMRDIGFKLNKTILILGAVAAITIVPLISGCSYRKASPGNGSATYYDSNSLSLTKDNLQEVVVSGCGDTTLVRNVTLLGEGMEKSVEVEIDRPATCGDASVEGTMSTFARKIMSNLFDYSEVSSVTITMYGIDQGVKSNDVASRVVVNRATAKDIDWSMLGPMTISSMATEYFVHPKILKNSNAKNISVTSPSN